MTATAQSDATLATDDAWFRPYFLVDDKLRVSGWPDVTARTLERPAERTLGRHCWETMESWGCTGSCHNHTLQTLAKALSLGLDAPVTVETPLMYIDKAGTWALAHELGGDALVDLIVEDTHTCYLGDRTHRHAWGYGCGTCPACDLRANGWAQWRGGELAD